MTGAVTGFTADAFCGNEAICGNRLPMKGICRSPENPTTLLEGVVVAAKGEPAEQRGKYVRLAGSQRKWDTLE